jgi:hypothetical protein
MKSVLFLAVVLALAGCSATRQVATRQAASALARQAPAKVRSLVDNATPLPNGTVKLQPLRQPFVVAQVDPVTVKVENTVSQWLTRNFGDETVDEAIPIIRAACTASDFHEIYTQTTFLAAAQTALINLGGDATQRARVAGLAEDLSSAKDSYDVVQQFSVFVICESV